MISISQLLRPSQNIYIKSNQLCRNKMHGHSKIFSIVSNISFLWSSCIYYVLIVNFLHILKKLSAAKIVHVIVAKSMALLSISTKNLGIFITPSWNALCMGLIYGCLYAEIAVPFSIMEVVLVRQDFWYAQFLKKFLPT